MLFWSPNCLGISYSAANYFTFKPFVPPPQKKIKKKQIGEGRTSLLLPPRSLVTPLAILAAVMNGKLTA